MAVRRLGGRIVAFAATVALSIPLGLLTNSAWAVEDATRSDSTTQMSSTPEVVYSSAVDSKQNRTSDFDANWKFMLSDSVQAQDPTFDDSAWQQVDLPHDYSITQKYSQSNEAESAYLPGGTGWYRKSFTIDRDLASKRIAINFDGVYMNATVWFNGVKLGTHPYGYSPFSFDLTGNAKFGEENTIVVKVENRLPSSRWYSGSGIYRDVTLTVTDGVHVGNNGVAIKTPSLATQNGGNVTMNLTTKVANDTKAAANITLKQTVFPKGGKTDAAIGTVTTASKSIAAGASADVTSTITARPSCGASRTRTCTPCAPKCSTAARCSTLTTPNMASAGPASMRPAVSRSTARKSSSRASQCIMTRDRLVRSPTAAPSSARSRFSRRWASTRSAPRTTPQPRR